MQHDRISEARQIVFIHINKTGGSSIAAALKLAFEHKTAVEKREEIGLAAWDRSLKFTFVRNPWDKVVSHYFYRVQTNQAGMGDGHIDFRNWVYAAYHAKDPVYYNKPKMFMAQTEWICDSDGRSLVDFVGRYESLNDDFRKIQQLIAQGTGVEFNEKLPHIKRSEHRPYREYYDRETIQIVADHFAADLARFGYTWRETGTPPASCGLR